MLTGQEGAATTTVVSGCTFVCYAREDLQFVRGLTDYLRHSGIPVWVDTDIVPGADWDHAIDEQLRTCTSVLIILSPDAVASDEVRGELRTALNLAKTIVPVICRPCGIPRQLQNTEYVDFTSPTDVERSREALVLALRQAPVDQRRSSAPTDQIAGRDLRNRRDFLDDIRTEAAGRLAQSLPAGMLNVLKEQQPAQVTRRWDEDVKIGDQHRTAIAAEVTITEIFEDEAINGKLLILGAPGSGKTTALLELGQELIARADRTVAEPMPVFCNLSSWRHDRPELGAWLVDLLKAKYGVRKDHGTVWLHDRLLLPLLDGLDEVDPEHQESCVEAINRFQQDFNPKHIVVCCRLAEYENYSIKLQLNGAVRLLPLVDDQIRNYLAAAEAQALWTGINGDEDTKELARSPLLLRMITVALHETAADEWQRLSSASERQAHLFDVYIRRVLADGGAAHRFSNAQTVGWLAWLARALKDHGQPELLLERMQPTWLGSTVERLLYRIAVAASVAIVFVLGIVVLTVKLFDFIPKGAVGLELGNAVGGIFGKSASHRYDWLLVAAMGLAAGIIVAARKTIQPIETLVWSWARGWRGLTNELRRMSIAGLNYMAYLGLVTGLVAGLALLWQIRAAEALSGALARFSLAGYVVAALAMLCLAVVITRRVRPAKWLWAGDGSARGVPADALVSGLAFAAGASFAMGPMFAAPAGLVLGIIVWSGGPSELLSAARFADALVIGLITGFGGGVMIWTDQTVKAGFIDGVGIWMLGGVGVAATSALLIGVAGACRIQNLKAAPIVPVVNAARSRMRPVLVGAILAVTAGVLLIVARRTGGVWAVRGIGMMGARIGAGWTSSLVCALGAMALSGVFGMFTGAYLGALFGVLSGLTGPDVVRRAVPNQGIRQSARNAKVFALAGILIVGAPYGVMNLIIAVLWTRTAPSTLDYLHLAVSPALLFGVMAALVPGAACIQHFTLRFVLWSFGLAPLRTVGFLNYATERMLLQRVGGRYRFIHDLLREHLAALHPKPMRP